MASGFQQDNNQITPGLYRVVINATSFPSFVGSGNALATQGAINPYDWTQGTWYVGGLPTSAGYATVLAQGNVRWDRIVELLTSYADARILDVSVTTGGSSANYQPTGLSFTAAFDRDQGLLTEYSKVQAAAGNATSGYYVIQPAQTGSTQGTNNTQLGASYTYTAYNTLSALQAAGYSGIDNVRVFQAYVGNDGSTAITSPQLAVQDIVTTAICSGGTTGWSRTYRLFSVAQNGDSQTTISIQQPATPATVFGLVTVSPVALTGISY
jgi:hypothetical protein